MHELTKISFCYCNKNLYLFLVKYFSFGVIRFIFEIIKIYFPHLSFFQYVATRLERTSNAACARWGDTPFNSTRFDARENGESHYYSWH